MQPHPRSPRFDGGGLNDSLSTPTGHAGGEKMPTRHAVEEAKGSENT
jgi:hypothetical protein